MRGLREIAYINLVFGVWFSLLMSLDITGEGFGTVTVPLLKYLPYIFAAIAFPFFLLSVRVRFAWYSFLLFCFMILMLCGSVYALIIMQSPIEESYFGRALGGVVFAAFYWMSFDVKYQERFFTRYERLFLTVSILMAMTIILFRANIIGSSVTQMYHADIGIIISGILLLSPLIRNNASRTLLFIVLILSGMLSGKTTAVIVTLLLLGLYMIIKTGHLMVKWKSFDKIAASGIVITALIILAINLTQKIDSRLENRENEVRATTSALRTAEFYSSPIVGNGFTGTPLVDVSTLHIPSHSDLLDLLAFGGLMTIILFYVPLGYVLIKYYAMHLNGYRENWLLAVTLAFLTVMLINPVISQPRLGFIFFSSIGWLAGHAVQMNRKVIIK